MYSCMNMIRLQTKTMHLSTQSKEWYKKGTCGGKKGENLYKSRVPGPGDCTVAERAPPPPMAGPLIGRTSPSTHSTLLNSTLYWTTHSTQIKTILNNKSCWRFTLPFKLHRILVRKLQQFWSTSSTVGGSPTLEQIRVLTAPPLFQVHPPLIRGGSELGPRPLLLALSNGIYILSSIEKGKQTNYLIWR